MDTATILLPGAEEKDLTSTGEELSLHLFNTKGIIYLTRKAINNNHMATLESNKKGEKESLETQKRKFPCMSTEINAQFWLLQKSRHMSSIS